ncbi:MAG: hypothetical protein VX347_02825 [Bacteroidota bacterium]|nr:hypothetical protein [Bacteroidota bacterium]
MEEFNSLLKSQKYAFISSVALALSVFMPWADIGIMSASLMDLPKFMQLAEAFGNNKTESFFDYLLIYSGYILLILGGASAYFNFKSKPKKAKNIYFVIIGYLLLSLISTIIKDGSSNNDFSALNVMGVGMLIFIISLVAAFIYTKRSILELEETEENDNDLD